MSVNRFPIAVVPARDAGNTRGRLCYNGLREDDKTGGLCRSLFLESLGSCHGAWPMMTKAPLGELASVVTPQDMVRYQATARRRAAKRRQAIEARRQATWEIAKRAAALLKSDYGVSRVVLFGSLSRDEPFSFHSDIDLAV